MAKDKEKDPAKSPKGDRGAAKKEEQATNAIGNVSKREIVDELKESYIDYAMSVIVARALPDVRDGLKPMDRKMLYTMNEMGLNASAKFRKSATVVGECFVKDTLILSKKGLVSIQDIQVGDEVYTQKGMQKVVQTYEMPEKPLLKVVLDNGLSNVVTLSQKFKVLTPDWKFIWKEAKDLTDQDYLIIKSDYPEIGHQVKLQTTGEDQPSHLNENVAYILGLFVSDGWISEDYSAKKTTRIGFTAGNDKEIAERIVSIFKKEFNHHPSIEERLFDGRRKKIYNVRVNSAAINEFFVANFDIKGAWALTKKIPNEIFQSPSDIISSFISGLIEGDGYISHKQNRVNYVSISEKLTDQLMALLLSQGIFSSKYKTDVVSGDSAVLNRKINGKHPSFSLEIKGENAVALSSKLNLVSKSKGQRAARLGSKKLTSHDRKGPNRHDVIPYASNILFQELSNNHLGGGWYQDVDGEKFRMGVKYPDGTKIRYSSNLHEMPLRKTQVIDWGIKDKLEKIGSPNLEFLEEIIKNKIHFLKVSLIKKVAPQKTFDFEVENDHEFIANGVVSHNCMGKYHPHGDMAIYDSLVRMAQDFNMRYPLAHPQGNFGSQDGDSAAAPRYTEIKLSKIGELLLADIEKDTVRFMDNYDGTRQEPTVLPSPVPQLLLNGSLGIAVGMATNIPPHNLTELTDAISHILDNPKAETPDLFQFIQGPDFPTGGIIYDQKEIITAYSQGKGSIVMRGKAEITEKKDGSEQILITEIPYQVLKSTLVEEMANLVSEKKIEGIRDIKDLSDREGMGIIIDIKKGFDANRVLNRLYKFTNLQKTFHLNLLALVDGIQPEILSIADVLKYFISHRTEVVTRRTKFDLEKAKDRAHILEGLMIALNNIDAVIKVIKQSKDREDAKLNLIKKFKLSEKQAVAILEMKLQTLAGLERQKIQDELKAILELIKELTAILASPAKLKAIIKKELAEVKEKFGDARRTKVVKGKLGEITEIDLVPLEETIVTLTTGGYIKRINPATYKIQKRGGKGIIGMKTMQEDIVEHFLSASTHDNLMFFTDSGKVFQTQVYEIPEGTRVARGRGISNFLEGISNEEKVLSLVTKAKAKPDAPSADKYLVMVTKNGRIKKTSLEEFENVRKSGIIAIKLEKGDALKKVVKTSGEDDIVLATKSGIAIRFKEKDIRPMGRSAAGVKGIRIKGNDEVIGMDVVTNEAASAKGSGAPKQYLMVVMENGYGKRTEISEYKVQGRGGSGIKTANITAKTGGIVISSILHDSVDEEDLIVISQHGQVIRTATKSISVLGRATQGVRIMRLEPGDKVASGTCVKE